MLLNFHTVPQLRQMSLNAVGDALERAALRERGLLLPNWQSDSGATTATYTDGSGSGGSGGGGGGNEADDVGWGDGVQQQQQQGGQEQEPWGKVVGMINIRGESVAPPSPTPTSTSTWVCSQVDSPAIAGQARTGA
jgi:hypothetical protein